MASLPKLAAGDTFVGEYEVVRVVSEERDRIVAEITHLPSAQRQALKVILPADDGALETFVVEMQRAAAVSSKNIVSVTAVGVDEASGCPYVVTEFLEGDDLATHLKNTPAAPLVGWLDRGSRAAFAAS